MSESIHQQICVFFETYHLFDSDERPTPIVIGVSGGVDSLVLLHALYQLRDELNLELHVATLDHGLRPQWGASDADFVERTAHQWKISFSRGQANVSSVMQTRGTNLEDAARQIRYAYLMSVACSIGAEFIAIAHNRDDLSETVLMNVIRGTGLKGLRGILPMTALSDDHILEDVAQFIEAGFPELGDTEPDPLDYTVIRPLLACSRAEIRTYAQQHDLTPREDETNFDLTRFRNRIRHEVLPHIEKMNPNIKEALVRLAQVAQADVEVIESRVDTVAAWLLDWQTTSPDVEGNMDDVVYLDRNQFREQPLGIQRGIIRKVLYELNANMREISFDQTERVRQMILSGATNAQYELPNDLKLFVGYDEVHLGYSKAASPAYPRHLPHLITGQYVHIDPEGQGYMAGHLRLQTYWVVLGRSTELWRDDPLECTLSIPEGAKLALRTRQDGDKFKPLGMGGKSQKLSDIFTNIKVPSYLRDQVPLLIVNDEVAWFVAPTVTGPVGRIAHTFAVKEGDNSVLRLRWQIEK